MTATPAAAQNHGYAGYGYQGGYQDRGYRGDDGYRGYDDASIAAAAATATTGAAARVRPARSLAGSWARCSVARSGVAGRYNRPSGTGAIVGAGGGALLGREIDRGDCDGRHYRR
ncbi:MAG: hypothetical protein WDN44_06190 [Sphingomonas sp.]